MKQKLIKIFCVVIMAIIIFLVVKDMILPLVNNIVLHLDKEYNNDVTISNNEFNSLKYKSAAIEDIEERDILDMAVILINENLIKNNEFASNYDDIDRFYELQPYFLEYKLYLSTKYKVKQILDELPSLINKTAGLSESGINSYYEQNSEYIDKVFGIENAEEFKVAINSLKPLKSQKKLKLTYNPDSIFHNTSQRTISIFSIIEGKDSMASVNFKFMPYYSTVNQSAPYVKIVGIDGGMS